MHDSGLEAPTLYIFSGLPGSGKSTLSQTIARQLGAVYLRIDTIEQGLRDLCSIEVEGEGYRLAYRIAFDNLCAGMSVVADFVQSDRTNQARMGTGSARCAS